MHILTIVPFVFILIQYPFILLDRNNAFLFSYLATYAAIGYSLIGIFIALVLLVFYRKDTQKKQRVLKNLFLLLIALVLVYINSGIMRSFLDIRTF